MSVDSLIKQLIKAAAGHPQAAMVFEVFQIQPEGAIRFDVDQVCFDCFRINGIAVRGKPHQFVFSRVDLKAAVIREC